MHSHVGERLLLCGMRLEWLEPGRTFQSLAKTDRTYEEWSDLFLVMQALVIVFEIWGASTFLSSFRIVLVHYMTSKILLPEGETA